jgi:hypothetical protein
MLFMKLKMQIAQSDDFPDAGRPGSGSLVMVGGTVGTAGS